MVLVWIAKIFATLNANVRPGEIAAGLALAFLAALIPGGNLVFLAIVLISFLIKINQAIFFVFLGIFKLFIGIFDPLLDSIGYSILIFGGFNELFIVWTNTAIVPWTRFNDTLVMGGLALGLGLFIPLFFLFRYLVVLWRTSLQAKILASKAYQAFIKWPLVSSISGLLGKVFNIAKEFI